MAPSARTPRHRVVLVLVSVLVLLGGATLAAYATRTGPFAKDGYCWGAWSEDGGPGVLGDDYARAAETYGTPGRGEAAICVVAFGAPGTEEMRTPDTGLHGAAPGAREGTRGQRLVARVGPPPRATGGPRRAWLAEALPGSAAPLPDGLPGVAGRDHGTLVLPEECDTGHVPLVVTVRADGGAIELGPEQDVAQLLLSLAKTAREKAGCAEGPPMRFTTPVRTAPGEESYDEGRPACRVPGLRLAPRRGDVRGYAGAIGDRLQSCSLELTDKDGDVTARGHFVLTSHPRLVPLFAGMAGGKSPGAGWRGNGRIEGGDGLVTAECRGRPTVFHLHLDGPLARAATPDTRAVFARAADSVTERLGCPPVGPRG